VLIAVVGGGIAGLAAALRLRDRADQSSETADQGTEIVLFDRADRFGGKLHTGAVAGEPVEAGAEMFLLRDGGLDSAAFTLAHRVGLAGSLVYPAPVPAAIAVGRELRPIPGGTLLGIPSDLSTLDGLARAVDRDTDDGQPLLGPGQDIAVGELVRTRLGDDVVDRLVDPMLGGVYAGHADALSLAATMPGLHAAAQRQPTLLGAVRATLAAAPRPANTPVFATVDNGMTRLVEAVLAAAGPTSHLGSPVRELTRTAKGWELAVGSTRDSGTIEADAVILATSARPAARLLANVTSDFAATVGELEYASVALVSLAFPPGTTLPNISGFLVPATEGYAIKAATFVSVKWPHVRHDGAPVLVRVSIGRYGEERDLQRSDDELAMTAYADLAALVGDLPRPVGASVTRWGGALPQYAVGHVERIAEVRRALPPTLAVAGAAYDGVGIAACVRSGETAAESVWTALRESTS
jgi:oxygen-dependent protoporphyrinogen oxidase